METQTKFGPPRNSSIQIDQVANGFIVRPGYDIRHGPTTISDFAQVLVFRTMSELAVFISEHFEHRAKVDANDKLP